MIDNNQKFFLGLSILTLIGIVLINLVIIGRQYDKLQFQFEKKQNELLKIMEDSIPSNLDIADDFARLDNLTNNMINNIFGIGRRVSKQTDYQYHLLWSFFPPIREDASGKTIRLNSRYYNYKKQKRDFSLIDINLEGTALILINAVKWPDDGSEIIDRIEKNISEKLVPLVRAAREYGLLIIHVTNNNGSVHPNLLTNKEFEIPIDTMITISEKEVIINCVNPAEVLFYIEKKKITHLIYAGYSMGISLTYEPGGIIAFRKFGWMRGVRHYPIFMVRDACITSEINETIKDSVHHKAMATLLEFSGIGWTITTNDLITALKTPG